jgi:hypothetical protein
MRPRFEIRNERFFDILEKTHKLEQRIEKAAPEYTSQKEGSTQGSSRFETQPGQVPNVFYNTNNVVPEWEDVTNKGATSEKSNVLNSPSGHYPTSESTLASHEGGSDERAPALTKKLGTDGEQLAMDTIAKSIDNLSRRLN